MFLRAPTTYAINYLNLLSKANTRKCKTTQIVEKETSYKLQTLTSTENLGVVNMLDVLDIS
jgi:hypothetical protein